MSLYSDEDIEDVDEPDEFMPIHPRLGRRNDEELVLDHALKHELELDVIEYDFDGNYAFRRAHQHGIYDRIMEAYRLGTQVMNGSIELDDSDTQSGTSKILALLKRPDAPELLRDPEVQDRIKEFMKNDDKLRKKLFHETLDKLKGRLNSEEHLKEIATKEIEKDMAENNETLNKFKKLIKDPEEDKNAAEELKQYVIDSFPKGDEDFDYLKLDDSAEVDAILYRLREFGVIEHLAFSIESKSKKISATINTDEDFNEYKEVLDSMFIKGKCKGNITWVTDCLGDLTEDFQNGDDGEVTELDSNYILVYSHKLNKFRLYTSKEFEFAWGASYDELYEDNDKGNNSEVQSEDVIGIPTNTSNSNCISWT